MKKILLGTKKNFYKANMHCHSTLSDGTKTPEELKVLYKSHGYSVLAITDHELIKNNSYLDDEDFLTVTSTELAIKEFPEQSTLKNYAMKVCHLNLYAKEQSNDYNVCYNSVYDHFTTPEARKDGKFPETDFERQYGAEGINRLIKTANDNGFFVAYNHPRWSLENYGDYSGYEGLWGVEIYNYSANRMGLYEYDINVLDDFLRDGKKIFATSGDDNHNLYDDSFGTFLMINSDRLVYGDIIDSLLAGDFYTSTGPEIYEISIDGMNVRVKCSNAESICITTRGRRSERVENANEATFILNSSDVYFRVSVTDKCGKTANSQAYYI